MNGLKNKHALTKAISNSGFGGFRHQKIPV